jgi:DNA-directed RNA polymerase specialized sigma24 family protein
MIMTKFDNNTLNRNNFEDLLKWLDEDREAAGNKYESIRVKLQYFFGAKGCTHSEELADETIDRVLSKVEVLQNNYCGDPINYFFGVAKNVFREYKRRTTYSQLPKHFADSMNSQNHEAELLDFCLQMSLNRIPPEQRRFILDYYSGTKSEKINRRMQISQNLNINRRTLRVQAYRIRSKIQTMFFENLNQASQ